MYKYVFFNKDRGFHQEVDVYSETLYSEEEFVGLINEAKETIFREIQLEELGILVEDTPVPEERKEREEEIQNWDIDNMLFDVHEIKRILVTKGFLDFQPVYTIKA